MLAGVKTWWYSKVQSHVSTVLIAFGFIDITGYSAEITHFIGTTGYMLLRLVGLGTILYRAIQVRRGPDPS